MKYTIGIDLGGTKVAIGLATQNGRIVTELRETTNTSNAVSLVNQLNILITKILSNNIISLRDITGIGIGIPGIVDNAKGIVIWAPNLPGWRNLPLRKLVQTNHKIPVLIENDVDTAALGEAWLGAGKGMKNLVFVAIGTGIGSGIIIDGELYRGCYDISGAIGWFVLGKEGLNNKTACYGHFESVAAGPGIARRTKELINQQKKQATKILDLVSGKINKITAKTVFTAARQGDELANQIIEETVTYLGMGIANIVSLLNPESVIIGGGVGQAKDLLLPGIKKFVKNYAQPIAAKKVKILSSKLGDKAGLIGALRLPLI